MELEAERKGYEFPVAGEVAGLDTANGSEATINIPQELLLARANGMLKYLLFLSYITCTEIYIHTSTFHGTNMLIEYILAEKDIVSVAHVLFQNLHTFLPKDM